MVDGKDDLEVQPSDEQVVDFEVARQKARADAGVQIEAQIPECLHMSDSAERALVCLRVALRGTNSHSITIAKERLRTSVVAWAVETGLKAFGVVVFGQVRSSGIFTDSEVTGMDTEIRAKLATAQR